jgi:hypothetical protein
MRSRLLAGLPSQVRGREHDAGGPQPSCLDQIRPAAGLSAAIAPGARRFIEPAAVRQAAAGGALEPDPPAQLRPMRRVEAAELATDWHGDGSLSRAI